MKRVRLLILLVAALGGALFAKNRLGRPHIEVSGKPVPNARVQSIFSAEQLGILENSRKAILFLIRPENYENLSQAQQYFKERMPARRPLRGLFHGYPVLEKVELTDTRKNTLTQAFFDGIANGEGYKCYSPGYAVRFQQGHKTVDVVICFDCEIFQIWPDPERRELPISASARPVFDALLQDAGIRVSWD